MPVLQHDGADLFYQVEGKGPPLFHPPAAWDQWFAMT